VLHASAQVAAISAFRFRIENVEIIVDPFQGQKVHPPCVLDSYAQEPYDQSHDASRRADAVWPEH
jgi:hypothetical protein